MFAVVTADFAEFIENFSFLFFGPGFLYRGKRASRYSFLDRGLMGYLL